MSVEVSLNTPLADALNTAIQRKLIEAGWVGDVNDSALAEYIILMLVNGKTQDQIAHELATELLNLSPEDPSSGQFAQWLFEQIHVLNAQLNGGPRSAVADAAAPQNEIDTDMSATTETPEINAPTGPRSMRNGNNNMRGRDKRMMGQMSKAMDRTGDSALHRVGRSRIDSHNRGLPTGPRGAMRGGRGGMNNRNAASIQHGLANMGGPGGPGPMMMGVPGPMGGPPGGGMDVYAILEQQNQMMMQLSQQLMNSNGNGNGHGGYGQHQNRRGGKSLFDRVQNPHHRHNNHGRQNNGQNDEGGAAGANGEGEGDDVDMSGGKREAPNPDETVCKYNLHCTNRECKFAHQSPAAPPGTHVDITDVCSFGAACKNRKCVGRHPSPAAKLAHQGEQDCKFFPNCQNPRCPFRHPSMPLCRNGPDCTTEGCKFTHVKTKCRFNPCLNPACAFVHDEGQQGGFKDKVWTAEGPSSKEHVSDRRFVGEGAGEELVLPGDGQDDDLGAAVKPEDEAHDQSVQDAEVIG
ncbi:hypothetical protein GMORB2_6909 [Geosmithia morbida]|uniref:Nab2-like CCCH zinc finger domain-containing protein n=1 Tax=Geosmithia morbida TaxID=1094350 RepID=A0A9P4YVK2_9HYPO|nr:uncharacterized protein GMORB2_6909 [Geosmithia morbida]KAF4122602.1 hypothetical protein GMORB2_6909 [Geosmithia morbida]